MVEAIEGDTLGERIRAARKIKGMSQGVLSKKCGVSQQLLSKIEAGGGGTNTEKLVKIADALGVVPYVLDPAFDATTSLAGSPPRKSPRENSQPPDDELSSFLERLAGSLEGRLGFRPTYIQAIKYLARIADPADDLELRKG